MGSPRGRPFTPALTILGLGVAIALAGDACHVASHTTSYDWHGLPTIWKSVAWFPAVVGTNILGGAYLAHRLSPPATTPRTPQDGLLGAALVLGLYALTAALKGTDQTTQVVLTGAIAIAIWLWWDPSLPPALAGLVAAVAGPAAEILVTHVGAAHYASDSDGLWGVAPFLPALYFAAGAVTSRLWQVFAA